MGMLAFGILPCAHLSAHHLPLPMNIEHLLDLNQNVLTDFVTRACNGEDISPLTVEVYVNQIKAIKLWLEVIPTPDAEVGKFVTEANIQLGEWHALTEETDTQSQEELERYSVALRTVENDRLLPFAYLV